MAQTLLSKQLKKHGYTLNDVGAGLWTLEWRPVCFSLVVDNFGVKYVGQEDTDHLIAALENDYDIEVDTEGDKYVGISLDWDYVKGEVHVSMPGYVSGALSHFRHIW